MKIASFLLNITSENPEKLIEFYRDTLCLEPNPDIGEGGFNLGNGTVLHIDGHSQTHDMTKEPNRILIDFFVESAEAEQTTLKAKGVTFSRELGVEFWGGIISTFADPDGNTLQIIEFDPSKATAPALEGATANA